MKSYPSILKFPGGSLWMHTFDKLDGSNLRFEWSKKRGWYKSGTRNRMFDETDDQFGEAIPLFKNTLADQLAKICFDNRFEKVVVFAEFWGENSFAGLHDPRDDKTLTVIDVSVHRRGMLGPRDFLKLFGSFGPNYLGEYSWTNGFVEQIKANDIEGITFEGVVGKHNDGKKIVMYKAKTQQWIDKVKEKFGIKAIDIING